MEVIIEGGARSRQAKPRRRFYPRWGLEKPEREWNGHSLYRGGVKDPLMRYIIAPKAAPVLDYGVTVLDVILCVAVAAIVAPLFYLSIDAFGVAFDGYLNACGY